MGVVGLFGRQKGKTKRNLTRIFFATDIHGSVATFNKLLKGVDIYGTDTLVLGGDVTGKLLIPIIATADGKRRVTLHDRKIEIASADELEATKANIELLGYYHVEMTEEEFLEVRDDRARIDRIFAEHQKRRLLEWIGMADQRFQGTETRLIVSGGNDDDADVLKVLSESGSQHVVACEDRRIPIGDAHTMVSLGLSNITPWHTPREYSEDTLASRIKDVVAGIDDFTNVVFNFHVPPFDSSLDMCPQLDTSTDPPTPITRGGQLVFIPVGSTAVREAIEEYQPLAVLCGHIHEARGVIRIGRTVVINPGSEYGEGVLRGVIVNLAPGEVVSWQFTAG